MKCSKCNHFVTNVYEGCDWCKMPDSVKADLDHYDYLMEVARGKKAWATVEGLAERRIKRLMQYQVNHT